MKTKLNMPGFKLKHMSALPRKEYGEVEEPKINRNFPPQENKMPEGEGRYNAALNSNHHDFDPKNRQIVENMPQHVKDSLHDQANKYGKSFWSDQHQVNVDPEDGVLSNRPRDVQGNYFKFETENKPIEERVKDAYTKIHDEYLGMAGKKKHPLLPAKDKDQMFQEFLGEYHSSKYDPETGKVILLGNEDGGDGFISEEELAKVPSYLRNPYGM